MADLARFWNGLVNGLHGFFVYIDFYSTAAPLQLGYTMIVLGALIKGYQLRRRYYRDLRIADDWSPSYGNVVATKGEEIFYSTAFWVCLFFGLMVLFQRYAPVAFDDVFGFLIGATGKPIHAS